MTEERPLQALLDQMFEETIDAAIGREVHEMLFGEYYAPGGSPNCGYRGKHQPNVNLRGIGEVIG